jgi:mRNA interferase MazF
MSKFPKRGDIYWVNLDPTLGSEIKKRRPCVIVSPNVANEVASRVIILPITSSAEKVYRFQVLIELNRKQGKILTEQIRTVDKMRLGDKIGSLDDETICLMEQALKISLGLT